MRWLVLLAPLIDSAFAWNISNAKAALRSQGDMGDLEYTPFGGTLYVTEPKAVEVRFDILGEGSPQQAFAVLEDVTGKHITVPAKVRKGQARLVVPSANLKDGRCTLRAYVASEHAQATSDVLELMVSLPPVAPQEQSKFAEANGINFHVLPEIRHIFRGPPSMANPVVALVFVGVIGALFVVLLGAWQSEVGIKIGAVPFVGSLAAIEAVFLAYYVQMSIFSAISWAFLFSVAAIFLGHQALNHAEVPKVVAETPKEIEVTEKTEKNEKAKAPKKKTSKTSK